MVMYDVIKLERDLPDSGNTEVEFRSNDLKNACFVYHITFTGRIERIIPVFEIEPKEQIELLTTHYARVKHFVRERVVYHGFLTFYSDECVYTANFSYGMLLDIRPGGREAWLPSEEGGSIDPWDLIMEIQAALSGSRIFTPEIKVILRSINKAFEPSYRNSQNRA